MAELALPCFTVAASKPNGCGVVVIHEGIGMTTQILRFTERLAGEGYSVLAPDLFFRTGGPPGDEWPAAMDAATQDQMHGDLARAIETLRGKGVSSIGVTGFCMGGRVTYHAAKEADRLGVDAAVAFYGGKIAEQLGDLHCPTQLIFGGRDQFIPSDDVDAVRARHGDAVLVYPDAGHGFMRDKSEAFVPDAAEHAWGRLLDFFGRHLQGRADEGRHRG